MEDFQKLVDFENLYNSYQVSLKGKSKKQSVMKFNVMALENLLVMKHQLINHTYKQFKKHLRKNAKLVKSGKMTRKKFDEKYASWKNHTSHGNCYKLICSMDKFVESLFNEELEDS